MSIEKIVSDLIDKHTVKCDEIYLLKWRSCPEEIIEFLRTSLEEYGREVIYKCIEALPKVDTPKKKLGRPRKFADSGVKVVKIKLLTVEQIKEILNNLK